MADSESDEDLKRAIKLSLQAHQPEVQTDKQPTEREIINLDSDDGSTTDDLPEEVVAQGNKSIQPEPPPPMGILGLDRKAMEQERLARKRRASISPPPPRKVPKISSPPREAPTATLSNDQKLESISSTQPSRLAFPDGVVKKTWAFGHPRQDDVKLEEVLERHDLNLAVLSSFQWDAEWLLRKINTKTTQLVFVMQADTDEVKAQYRRETAAMKNLRLCFPAMEGQINCMHSKLMLLSYPTHLRIVVPTANLVPYDWGETGIMENMVFLIDLPRLPADHEACDYEMTQFGQDLIYFLQATGLDQTIISSIHHFDFSATRNMAFVHTIGGAHTGKGEPWRRTGYCGLGRAVSQLGLASEKPLAIDYVTSSVGSLNMDFLLMLYLAAQGDDGLKEFNGRYLSVKKNPGHQWFRMKDELKKQVKERFRIYFPSEETVKASKGGPESGGTICFQRKWWQSDTFPKELLRDCKSQRAGMLMHNKIIYVRPQYDPNSLFPSPPNAWAYIGSANCSESAWGKLVTDRKEKQPKLNCRNWECGVVIPLQPTTTTEPGVESTKESAGALSIFEGSIPIPMQHPGTEYKGTQQPWFSSE
ncbi:MAG: hypothetical protein Q9216_006849 [Gyalolechia sp. 2 TL-2023]